MYVYEENMDACDSRTEPGTQSELDRGGGKGKDQCWETGIHWDLQGMLVLCFLQK